MRPLPRIWRSAWSEFGKARKVHDDLQDETVTANAAYDDDTLAAIAGEGFDAIWVHGLLHDLVPSTVFAEFGTHAEVHLGNLRALVERAGRHGLRVFLYMQPPRGIAVEHPFWQAHPEAGGLDEARISDDGLPTTERTLCTSTAPVRAFLRESSERLFRELPALGGVILITASEYTSHCYARYAYGRAAAPLGCPRCRERHPVEVVTELIRLVRDGIRAASSDAQIVCWNWSWYNYEPMPYPRLIAGLPDDVVPMSDFERGDRKVILGRERVIDEYSLSFAGPSALFRDAHRLASARGLPIVAKLQLGTTHELATVPNLPLIGNLYAKAAAMRELGVTGFMGCWNFGNMPTANTSAFMHFLEADPLPDRQAALEAFAADYFPGCEPAAVVAAWEAFGRAMDSFPFSIPFIYFGPMNFALSYPLQPGQANAVPAGRSWQMDPRGDSFDRCLQGYALAEAIDGLGQVVAQWQAAAARFSEALAGCTHPRARAEADNAWMVCRCYRSAWNVLRIFRLRRYWLAGYLAEYRAIVADEAANLAAALPIVERDPRFGWHSECQAYMYDAGGIRRKLENLHRQLS